MLSVEDWAEIRRLCRSERVSISEVARVMAVSRNTVKAALRSDGAPKYERKSAETLADSFEPRIRELLRAVPRMPATVIAERIGWPHGIRTLSGRIAELRPLYLPPDPAGRTSYEAGEIAQCDFWFPDIEVPVGFGQRRTAKLLPVLTMVTGYSRWAAAVLVPTRTAEDLYAGWWQHLSTLGACPRVLVWDGEGAVGRWRHRKPELTHDCQAFRGTLGAKVIICKPADPEAKGLVERFHDYLERSFLPGRAFTSPTDFNLQLQAWVDKANHRHHRRLGCRPADRLDADRTAMLTLPPVAPVVGWRGSQRLPQSLHSPRRQRLLGAPRCHRPADRDHREPAAGAGVLRRAARRRSRPGLGQTPNPARPEPRRCGERTAPATVGGCGSGPRLRGASSPAG